MLRILFEPSTVYFPLLRSAYPSSGSRTFVKYSLTILPRYTGIPIISLSCDGGEKTGAQFHQLERGKVKTISITKWRNVPNISVAGVHIQRAGGIEDGRRGQDRKTGGLFAFPPRIGCDQGQREVASVVRDNSIRSTKCGFF